MNATTAAIDEQDESLTPLDQLQALLEDDMQAVNTKILSHLQSEVAIIPQTAHYLISAGGKRIRPLLTLAATRLFGDTSDRPYALAAAVEFIHTATLLHDDVVDGSEIRRGKDAANLVFGNQVTVLVGDFLFSRAFQLMVSDGSIEILRILSDASAIISQGEVMQLTTANNLETSLNDYEEVIKSKTAALFAAACEIGPVIANQSNDIQKAMADYGLYMGIAFQIADDVLDYSSTQRTLGKKIGDDFREGKMTAPVILALQDADAEEYDFWARTIRDKNQTDEDLEHALEIINKHDALQKGMDLAQSYVKKSHQALSVLPQNDFTIVLRELADFVTSRDH